MRCLNATLVPRVVLRDRPSYCSNNPDAVLMHNK